LNLFQAGELTSPTRNLKLQETITDKTEAPHSYKPDQAA